MVHFTDAFYTWKKKNHKSNAKVAEMMGLDENTVKKWNDEHLPPTKHLVNLSDKLGVSIDYIMGVSNYTKPNNKLISQETGLSDNAINTLKYLNTHDDILSKTKLKALNTILDKGFNTGVLFRIGQYLDASPYIGYNTDGKDIPFVEDTGEIDFYGKPKIIHHCLSLIQENGESEILNTDIDFLKDNLFYKIRGSLDAIIYVKKK